MSARLLDRYVLRTWIKLFVVTAIGFPFVAVITHMVDSLNTLLDRGLSLRQILVSYAFGLPAWASQVMPAAVLVATVFTVSAMARHSEITAAKAGGASFHRLVAPILGASVAAALLAAVVGELAVTASARQERLQRNPGPVAETSRYNFVYRADEGWVYAVRSLDATRRVLHSVLLERQGSGSDYPTLLITADSATWSDSARAWKLWHGESRVIARPDRHATFGFRTMRLAALVETPVELLAEPRPPEAMRYAELGRYISALRRAGNVTGQLQVSRALRIALPAACIVIALFGAPLAVASPRGGTAWGIAVSLGSTIVYLLLIQIAKAVGAGEVMPPLLAAWLPNAVFLLAGLVLLDRVRT